jgi:hypothetical protein
MKRAKPKTPAVYVEGREVKAPGRHNAARHQHP